MTTTGTILRSGVFAAAMLSAVASPSLAGARELSFEERVEAQTAIEAVYWSHRIWPAENAASKPSLETVMPEAAVRAKVERDLRASFLLDAVWHEPTTGAGLQAELNRMAHDTQAPGTLRELFAALHHDPLLIAECLARPALTKRRLAELSAEGGPAATPDAGAGASARAIPAPPQGYVLPALPEGVAACTDDIWATSSLTNATGFHVPLARQYHTAVWTGSEMIVWGGWDGTTAYKNGGRYDPALDTWAQVSLTDGSGANVPSARYAHTAIWTGTEMIVWGGLSQTGVAQNNGGRYNPATDIWDTCTLTNATGANVPSARAMHSAVWTGTEMIVWGGTGASTTALNTGGRYDPSTDLWATCSLTTANGSAHVPAARTDHTAVWTGTAMIVWGGLGASSTALSTGGVYDPGTDTWGSTSLETGLGAHVPAARHFHTAVWARNRMIVWGGGPATGAAYNTGGRYDPVLDAWDSSILVNASGANVPAGRERHTAVWTGAEMIIWGGSTDGTSVLNTGGRYDPISDKWATSSLVNATGANVPSARQLHSAIFTGLGDNRMIVWGGSPNTATGGSYCAICTPKLWYQDADGDGYGNPAVSQSSCIPVPGYVLDHTDCNDADAAVHPGATEVCNGVDDNCNGTIDENQTTLCADGDACSVDVCGGFAGCLPTHKTANMDTTGFSANRVDGRDLAVLAAAWTSNTGGPADLDQNNTVDIEDFHVFMSAFGWSCP